MLKLVENELSMFLDSPFWTPSNGIKTPSVQLPFRLKLAVKVSTFAWGVGNLAIVQLRQRWSMKLCTVWRLAKKDVKILSIGGPWYENPRLSFFCEVMPGLLMIWMIPTIQKTALISGSQGRIWHTWSERPEYTLTTTGIFWRNQRCGASRINEQGNSREPT